MSEHVWIPKSRKNLSPETIQIINKVLDKIPTLPISVQKIIEMASDMDIGAKELAEVALTDPVLSSKIITMINSAYYSLNRHVDDLRVAIVLIGFNAVRNIAIQSRFLQVLDDVIENKLYDREKLWIHSYLVSVCAETFLKDDNPRRVGVLMTMGILHDIGKFALYGIAKMMEKKGIKFSAIEDSSHDTYLLEREERLVGVNHAIIGGMLANRWNLSDKIRAVLEYHHFPSFFKMSEIPSPYLEDITAICLADLAVNCFLMENIRLPEPHRAFFEILGLKPPIENILTIEMKTILSKAVEFVRSLT
jgi:HD-like signal output (HDOD) protein